ncbi:Uncharacterized protein TCAP_05564 [Tolypocladium capitatum]|uniref:Chromo domain-containing protein n=1 Tax=Tolypocladium capitatum TaxID=45235 RepID=A0A2K3QAE3_9HYPO|nr:Uncharacterized protein TCAP_05564 [Tolypocladium capitatum]
MSSILTSIFTPRKELPDTPRAQLQLTPRTSSIKKQQVRVGRDPMGGSKETATTPVPKTSKSQPSATVSRDGGGSSGKRGTAKPSTKKRSTRNDADAQLSPTPDASKRTHRRASKEQPDASEAAEETREEEQHQEPDQGSEQEQQHGDEYSFKRFGKHRWAGNSIEIQVEWVQGDVTWEPEANLHQDAPQSLFAYWKRQGGRPNNPSDPDLFDIFAILKHSKDRKRLLIEWVGFGPKDATWVSRAAVEETAPDVAAEYWASVKPAAKRPTRRRQ